MNGSRDCWSCGKRPTECMGQAGPSDIEMACWVPAQVPSLEEAALAARIPTGRELTGSAQIEHRAPTATELTEQARRMWMQQEEAERAAQVHGAQAIELEREIYRQITQRIVERYPETPPEAFTTGFIPSGVRIIAPDGWAYDCTYRTTGPEITENGARMVTELTIKEHWAERPAQEGEER